MKIIAYSVCVGLLLFLIQPPISTSALAESSAHHAMLPGSISVGGYHTCGLKADGSVLCWGNNDEGPLRFPYGTLCLPTIMKNYGL
jgi:hypothetical protein